MNLNVHTRAQDGSGNLQGAGRGTLGQPQICASTGASAELQQPSPQQPTAAGDSPADRWALGAIPRQAAQTSSEGASSVAVPSAGSAPPGLQNPNYLPGSQTRPWAGVQGPRPLMMPPDAAGGLGRARGPRPPNGQSYEMGGGLTASQGPTTLQDPPVGTVCHQTRSLNCRVGNFHLPWNETLGKNHLTCHQLFMHK